MHHLNSSISFHKSTNHSPKSIYQSSWTLDWENRPFPFKVYEDVESIELPVEISLPTKNSLISLFSLEKNISTYESINLDSKLLANFLFFTGGVTRIFQNPHHTFYMRTASATGALYPIEVYVLIQGFSDLQDGFYHFSPGDYSINRLREGNYNKSIANITSDSQSVQTSPLILFFSSYGCRNSWKYRIRSYRHWFWDGGVMMANALAVASSYGLKHKIISAFDDYEINKFCGFREKQEAIIGLITIGSSKNFGKDSSSKWSSLDFSSIKLAQKEYNFGEIWDFHSKTTLKEGEEIDTWNRRVQNYRSSKSVSKVNLGVDSKIKSDLSLEATILQRGSTNRFKIREIEKESLQAILNNTQTGLTSDFFPNSNLTNIEYYVNVHAVKDLEHGSYYYNSESDRLELLKSGNFRNVTSHLCLDQPLFGTSSALVFLLTDLKSLVNHFGDRSYRIAQLEGGILAGKIYLASYGLKLGARGTTFFDDDVAEFFSPHAKGKSVMMAVGIGIPDYDAKPGKKLGKLFSREELKNLAKNNLKK